MGESQAYCEQGGLADVTEEVKILLGMRGKLFIRNWRREDWVPQHGTIGHGTIRCLH